MVKAEPSYPAILFFHQGTLEDGNQFFGESWPEARAVSDPKRFFYDAFDLKAGGLRQLFGPGVWLKAIRAARKGHSIGLPIGSPWLMPGLFLLQGSSILWSWEFRHVGDHPDFAKLSSIFRKATRDYA